MKRLPVFLLGILLIASTAWIAGCNSPESAVPGGSDIVTRAENPDVNDAYGGYNMLDEAPAFGDATLITDYGEDPTFDDPIAKQAEVANMERAQGAQLFLRILWGNLKQDETIDHVTQWDGALKVDPGVILLKRVIRFEPTDHILPRTQRDLLEWTSATQAGFDGILVRIIPRPAPVSTTAGPAIDSSQVTISFQAGDFKAQFTLADLPGLHRVAQLDDGNAVAFDAVRIGPNDCPHGLLAGVWHDNPNRPGGVFFGKWENADGHSMGYLKGFYGVTDDGRNVLFGKLVNRQGRFEGLIKGEWGTNDAGNGWFSGRWVDRRFRVQGELKGEWMKSQDGPFGFFRGVWAAVCN
jgi:hypothetical protein